MGEERAPGGCEIYRIQMPFYYMSLRGGLRCDWEYFGNIVKQFRQNGVSSLFNKILQYDIFVFPRMFIPDGNEVVRESIAVFFETIRQLGKKIVYEVDDDFSNEYRHVVNGDSIEVASWCDAIIVSTPYLGERMSKLARRPVFVCPNCIDFNLWGDEETIPNPIKEDTITIALTGSKTHYSDWIILKDVIPEILYKHSNVTFILCGFEPDYFKGLEQTIVLPGMRYDAYSQIIRSSDIVLAPVNPDDGFNISKSPIKAVEGMAALRKVDGRNGGACVIATDNPVYRLAVKDQKTGLLVEHNEQSWMCAIEGVINDKEKRHRLQINAYKHAKRKFDIADKWQNWSRAYRKILEMQANTKKLPVPLSVKM
ncbi:MAG: hypothetical protein CUN55_00530 [Phototrophicales bacterium]|nr:MAG: hypothetical protein CUN55_00530 [Phototrophicales bacterium]